MTDLRAMPIFDEYIDRKARDFERAPLLRRVLTALYYAFPEEMQEGADGSHNVTINDFVALKASGVTFMYFKLTQGNYIIDDKYKTYIKGAFDAGMIVGGFHFFDASIGGVEQAKYFMEQHKWLEDLTGGLFLPPMNDVELAYGQSKSTIYNRTKIWHDTIDANIRESSLYTSPYLQGALNPYVPDIGHVAHWTSSSYPSLPSGWGTDMCKFWQYGIFGQHSWVRPLQGVVGKLDVDRFFGTMDELKVLAGYTTPPPSECPEECTKRITAIEQRLSELEQIIKNHDTDMENMAKAIMEIDDRLKEEERVTDILRSI